MQIPSVEELEELDACNWDLDAIGSDALDFLTDTPQIAQTQGAQQVLPPVVQLPDASCSTGPLPQLPDQSCKDTCTTQPPHHSKAEQARLNNRQSQRRARERKKTRLQQLEAELAETKAVLRRVQSERPSSSVQSQLVPSRQSARPVYLPMTRLTCHVPDVLDSRFTAQLHHMPWRSSAFLTEPLPQHQQAVCQQVANLSHHQLAGLWQSYIQRMGTCLLQSGSEMTSLASLQLEPLLNEFRCLHLVKARVTPREWRDLLNGIVVIEGAVGQTAPDWAKLARLLQFSPSQRTALFAARRKYIIDMARCARRRHWLMQQLPATPEATPVDSIQLATSLNDADDVAQQLQDCVQQEHLLLVNYMRTSSLEVWSFWQSAVAAVHAFPRTADVVAIVNALADDAGEPSAGAIQAAVTNAMLDTPAYDQDQFAHTVGKSSNTQPSLHSLLKNEQQAAFGITTDELSPEDIFS